MRLRHDVIVSTNHDSVWVINGPTGFEIEDFEALSAAELWSHLKHVNIDDLATTTDGQTLLDRLSCSNLLSESSEQQCDLIVTEYRNGIHCVTLDEFLSTGRSVDYSNSLMIFTRDEGLFIPAESDPDLVTWAIRLFVSGIQPDWRLKSYGHSAAVGISTVYNDRPTQECLTRVSQHIGDLATVSVVVFDTLNVQSFQDCPGRLHIVQELHEEYVPAEPFGTWKVATGYANPDLRYESKRIDHSAWGIDASHDSARTKSIAEAVERFASSDRRTGNRTFACESDLDGPVVDPRRIIEYSPHQRKRKLPAVGYNPSEQYLWIRGERNDGSPIYVLDNLAYYPAALTPNNPSYVMCSSSGVAAHTKRQDAMRRAYLELVERDAFMMTWLTGQSREHIDQSTLPEDAQWIISSLKQKSWQVDLVNLSQPGRAACVLAIAQASSAIVLGASAGDPLASARKALSELVPAIAATEEFRFIELEDVATPNDHQMLYRRPEYTPNANFLTASGEVIDLRDIQSDDRGPSDHAAYVRLDNTYPGSSEFEVWRCLDPDLVPISFGFDNEPLGHPRLAKYSWTVEPMVPHPFS